MLFNTNLLAQKLEGDESEDRPDSSIQYLLKQISVTATRGEKSVLSSPNEINIINAGEIESKNIPSTPDAFNSISSVYLQRTNLGGGSPILRGFIGNRVLILIDGVRLNNSTFRFGPNQYLNTINSTALNKIEVVYGPTSVLYGSDALGGVISLLTDMGGNSANLFGGLSRYSSAENSYMQSISLSKTLSSVDFYLNAAYKNIGDIKAGNGVVQKPSGYSEKNIDAKLNYSFGKINLKAAYQFVQQNDVPRTDRIAAGNSLKYIFDPQDRQLGYLKFSLEKNIGFINSLDIITSFQRQKEGRSIISANSPDVERNDFDIVSTLGVSVNTNTLISENNLLAFGFEYYVDDISSERSETIISSGIFNNVKPQFADGSKYHSLGFYVFDQMNLNRASITGGLRYSQFNFNGDLGEPFNTIQYSENDITFSFSFLYKLIPQKVNAYINYSQAFRAPGIDDLTAFGKAGSGDAARYDTPNPNLIPEKSNNFEFGLKAIHNNLETTFNIYYSKIYDLIEPGASAFNGLDSLYGYPVYKRLNKGKSEIYGWNLSLSYIFINPSVRLWGNISQTIGNNISDSEPLSRIPPFNGAIGIRWKKYNWFLEYYSWFAADQKKLSLRDIKDFRIGLNGTQGYFIHNIHLGIEILKWLKTNIYIENIFDKYYKTHGSGIYAPGRNFIIALKYGI
ncbi:MAG: TonB-dependent receptor [Ignavibacteriae bacterium]|nr:TonB-dependent receptor [Ignavibacteriota bacterium]